MKVLNVEHASLDVLTSVGQRVAVAVLGYGAQGRAQALCFKDSGLDVIVGVREGGASWKLAQEDGWHGNQLATFAEACERARVIHVLLPDELHKEIYARDIKPHLTAGKTLSFSHGFSIIHDLIVPPADVDVVMFAPKAPGTAARAAFVAGSGVPGLLSVHQDVSGHAKETALALAHAMGLTRAGLLECSFREEAIEDLFGEQTVLCGGAAELVKAGFETLVEAGYPPEMAYFECLHELKLVVDLIVAGGLTKMWDEVSNTAEYGGRTVGPKIITSETRKAMKEALVNIQNGNFARAWMAEHESGLPNLTKLREEEAKHPIEVVGAQVRALFKPTKLNNPVDSAKR